MGCPAMAGSARSVNEARRMMFSSVSASPSTVPLISPSRTTSTRSQRPISSGSSEETTTMPTPFRARSRRMRWISALAPTSTPRVGSSRKMTRGIDRQHLGDGDLLLVAARERGDRVVDAAALEAEAVAEPVRLLRLLLGIDRAPRGRDLAEVDRRDIGGDRQVEEDAVALAVLREVDDAVVDAVAVAADGEGLAVEGHLAAGAFVEAADALDDLAPAGADQSGDAEDLAPPERRRRRHGSGGGR